MIIKIILVWFLIQIPLAMLVGRWLGSRSALYPPVDEVELRKIFHGWCS